MTDEDMTSALPGVAVRPWVRFWARATDTVLLFLPALYLWMAILIVSLPIYAALVFKVPESLSVHAGLIITFALVFGYFALLSFTEAIMLSTWGTTPGKWFFGVVVRDVEGRKLGFWQAFRRAFLIQFVVTNGGLLPLSLVVAILAFRQLKVRGRTWWDRMESCRVSHEKIKPSRVLAALIISVGFLLIPWVLAVTLGWY